MAPVKPEELAPASDDVRLIHDRRFDRDFSQSFDFRNGNRAEFIAHFLRPLIPEEKSHLQIVSPAVTKTFGAKPPSPPQTAAIETKGT